MPKVQPAATTPPAPAAAPLPPLRLRGGWMMLLAGLCAVAAAIWHQTTILPWELGIGGPLLLVTALFMLVLRGGWRVLGALLAIGPAAWGLWQLKTYLPIFPDFLPPSWPIICLLPIACLLGMLASLRAWRSLWSPGWIQVPGQPPRKRRAPGGVILAILMVGAITVVGFLPHDLRSQVLRPLQSAPPSPASLASTGRANTGQTTPGSYDHNPVLPPMNTPPTASPSGAVPSPVNTSGSATYRRPANEVPNDRPVQSPRSYPNLARDLARLPVMQDVSAAQTAGRTQFTMGRDVAILRREPNADGTELLRVRAATTSEDSLGRRAQGTALLDVLVDVEGRILRTLVVDLIDPETSLLWGGQ